MRYAILIQRNGNGSSPVRGIITDQSESIDDPAKMQTTVVEAQSVPQLLRKITRRIAERENLK